MERVRQRTLCKYCSNEGVCFWLFQIHALHLWEVDSLSCYLLKQQPKTHTTTFPYKNSDPWKSNLYISHFRMLCYGLHLYSSLIEIHCGPSTSASFKHRSQITLVISTGWQSEKVSVLLKNLRTVQSISATHADLVSNLANCCHCHVHFTWDLMPGISEVIVLYQLYMHLLDSLHFSRKTGY